MTRADHDKRMDELYDWTTHDLALHIVTLESEIAQIRSGEVVVMPTSIEHAGAMHLLAERYIKDNRK